MKHSPGTVLLLVLLSTAVRYVASSCSNITEGAIPTTTTPTSPVSVTNAHQSNINSSLANSISPSIVFKHGHHFNHSHHHLHHLHHHRLHHLHHHHNHTGHNFTAVVNHLRRLSNATHHLLHVTSRFSEAFAALLNRTSLKHLLHKHRLHQRFQMTEAPLTNLADLACNQTIFDLTTLGLTSTATNHTQLVPVLNCTRLSDPTNSFLVLGQYSSANPNLVVANITRSLELLQHSSGTINGVFMHPLDKKGTHTHHGHDGHRHHHGQHKLHQGHGSYNVTLTGALNAISLHGQSLSASVHDLKEIAHQSGVRGLIQHLTRPSPSTSSTVEVPETTTVSVGSFLQSSSE